MKGELSRGQRLLRRWGWVLLALGLLCNPWTLGAALSADGVLDDAADLAMIYFFQTAAVCWGVGNVVFCRTPLVAKLNLLAASVLLVSPLLAEIGLRLAIAAGVPRFVDPGLYADSLCDDDYWKLGWKWRSRRSAPQAVFPMAPDELLGWAPLRGPDNPLGLADQSLDRGAAERPGGVLFYGDSFVQGTATTERSERIPQQMDRLLGERRVFNLGVEGYGVDQIFLHLRETHSQWRDPIVLVGILSHDLDRSVLRFRDAAKPYFVIRDGGLELQGPPLRADNDQWLSEHPPELKSFLFGFLKMRWRLHQPGDLREHPFRREEKMQLNRLLLTSVTDYCRRSRLPFAFVLFFDPDELERQGWRETFLLEEMQRLEAPCLNTKPCLLEAARQRRISVRELHQSDHHLNSLGNLIVAQRLVAFLRDEFPESRAASP